MLREPLMKKEVGRGAFRWRGREISRIEGLSDAVFGFAITLLVVSLEVPKPADVDFQHWLPRRIHRLCFSLYACVQKRNELELSTLEIFDTVSSVKENLLHCGIAIISIALVLIGGPQMADLPERSTCSPA